MDLFCAKCAEPWDAFGVKDGDMTRLEYIRFKQGAGCPACEFGTICITCQGTGTEDTGCATCLGLGRVVAQKLSPARYKGDRYATWFMKIKDSIRHIPKPYKMLPNEYCADGMLYVGWSWCPDCENKAPTCKTCHGSGDFQPLENENEVQEKALHALLENSEDDPIALAWAFGFEGR